MSLLKKLKMQENQSTNEEAKSDIQPIIEEKNWETPDFTFIPKGTHLWVQRGYYLICTSCGLSHAVFIGPNSIMVGFKDNEPVLKTRRELGMA